MIGVGCLAVELFACAVLDAYWLAVPALALGGFGNGLALVHDRLLLSHCTPASLHGRLFGLQKTCVSFAFAISFLTSSALIATARRPGRVPHRGRRPGGRDGLRAMPRLRRAPGRRRTR